MDSYHECYHYRNENDNDDFNNCSNCANCNHYNSFSMGEEVIVVNSAVIQSVYADRNNGQVTIAFRLMDKNQIANVNVLTLNVDHNTIIQNRRKKTLKLNQLRRGMIVYTEFSSAMTRSIPPQAYAYKIIVINDVDNVEEKIDTVIRVDEKNDIMYTGKMNDIYSQMKFVVTNLTTIYDRKGNRISLNDIRPRDTVRVIHANFQTASIPPQTTAYSIQVL